MSESYNPWFEEALSSTYLERADIQIVDRKRLIEILKSFYDYFIGINQNKKILDIGCGDGILTHELLKIDNTISATLIDGSKDMMSKAKKRLLGYSDIEFVNASFEEIMNTKLELVNYDFIFSSFAIHHLDTKSKTKFFQYIYQHLNINGYFVNTDIILSPTKSLEKWYLKLWKEWIEQKKTAFKLEGNYGDIIDGYQAESHYSALDTMRDQLDALKVNGFREIECYYKFGIFSMYGGKK